MSRSVHIVTRFQSYYSPGIKVVDASDIGSGAGTSTASFTRCMNINTSLAMVFNTGSAPSSSSAAVSFGLAYNPQDKLLPEGLVGMIPNSWGIIIDEEATIIAAGGHMLFAVSPVFLGSPESGKGDELRIDVNFRRSSAQLYVNNVLLHSFTLQLAVPNDSTVDSAVLEDFILGCVVSEGVMGMVVGERVAVADTRSRLARAMFAKDRLAEGRLAVGQANGIPYRGKKRLFKPEPLQPSQQEKQRNVARRDGLKEAYELDQTVVNRLLKTKDRSSVVKGHQATPLNFSASFFSKPESWIKTPSTAPISAVLPSNRIEFYFPGLEPPNHDIKVPLAAIERAPLPAVYPSVVNGSALEYDDFPSLAEGSKRIPSLQLDTSYLQTLHLFEQTPVGRVSNSRARRSPPRSAPVATTEEEKQLQQEQELEQQDQEQEIHHEKQQRQPLPRPEATVPKKKKKKWKAKEQASVTAETEPTTAEKPRSTQRPISAQIPSPVSPSRLQQQSSKISPSRPVAVTAVSSSLYKPPVQPATQQTTVRQPVLPKSALRLFTYDTLRDYDLLITIEHCDCCDSHVSLSHNQYRYSQAAENMLTFVRDCTDELIDRLSSRIDDHPDRYIEGASRFEIQCAMFGISSQPYCYELKTPSRSRSTQSGGGDDGDGEIVLKRGRAPASVRAAAAKVVSTAIYLGASLSLKKLVLAAMALESNDEDERRKEVITQRFGAFEVRIAHGDVSILLMLHREFIFFKIVLFSDTNCVSPPKGIWII